MTKPCQNDTKNTPKTTENPGTRFALSNPMSPSPTKTLGEEYQAFCTKVHKLYEEALHELDVAKLALRNSTIQSQLDDARSAFRRASEHYDKSQIAFTNSPEFQRVKAAEKALDDILKFEHEVFGAFPKLVATNK